METHSPDLALKITQFLQSMVVSNLDFIDTFYRQETGALNIEDGPSVLQSSNLDDLPTPASIIELWPDYTPSEIVYNENDFNFFKIVSYLFLPVNLFLQIFFAPAQYSRYYWVMTINGGDYNWDVLDMVATR